MNLIDKFKVYTGRQLSTEELEIARRGGIRGRDWSSNRPYSRSYTTVDDNIIINDRLFIMIPSARSRVEAKEKGWRTATYTQDGRLIERDSVILYPEFGSLEAESITTRYDPPGSFFGTTTRAMVKKA